MEIKLAPIETLPQEFRDYCAKHYREFALEIGLFTTAFARMEDAVNRTIHELLGLDEDTGYAITAAIMNVSTRLEILETLGAKLRMAKADRAAIIAAVDTASEINSFRNWVLHDAWSGMTNSADDPTPKHIKRKKVQGKRPREWRERQYSAADIRVEADRCETAIKALTPIYAKLSLRRFAKESRQKGFKHEVRIIPITIEEGQ